MSKLQPENWTRKPDETKSIDRQSTELDVVCQTQWRLRHPQIVLLADISPNLASDV